MKPFYIRSDAHITVLVNGAPYTVASDHPRYGELNEAIMAENWGVVRDVVQAKTATVLAAGRFGKVEVFAGYITLNGEPITTYLGEKILETQRLGLDVEPMAWFLDKVMENPDPRARADLWRWCEAGKMPIASDGDIIGYKAIQSDYTDLHTGTFNNRPGQVVEEDRAICDPNPHQICSTGLHFCAAAYLKSYGSGYRGTNRVVLVKINPRDITAFPSDYHLQKGRCCRYEVIEEIDPTTVQTFFQDFKGYYEVKTPPPPPEDKSGLFAVQNMCGMYLKPDGGTTTDLNEAAVYTEDEAKPLTGQGFRMVPAQLQPVTADLPEGDRFVIRDKFLGYYRERDNGYTQDLAEACVFDADEVRDILEDHGAADLEVLPAPEPQPKDLVLIQDTTSGQFYATPCNGLVDDQASAHPYPRAEAEDIVANQSHVVRIVEIESDDLVYIRDKRDDEWVNLDDDGYEYVVDVAQAWQYSRAEAERLIRNSALGTYFEIVEASTARSDNP